MSWKIGTRNMSMPMSTSVAKLMTISGYIIAPLTRRLIRVSFSIWKATRSRTTSRIPAASPASTIEMKRRENTRGWRAIASESRSPASTSARSSETTRASFLSSVCSSRMTRAVTTLRPASIIVANWREKTCSDFGLTFLTAIAKLCDETACSSSESATRPRTRSASRAAFASEAETSPSSSRPDELIAV
jgi:hypothetical protein